MALRFFSRWLAVWGVLLLATPLSATEPYIPNHFFGLQDPFYRPALSQRLSADLYNPANLADKTPPHIRISHTQDAWGYTQLSGGAVVRFPRWVAGLSVISEGANDFIATTLNANNRPVADHNFSDQQLRLNLSLAGWVRPQITAAMRVSALQTTLDTVRNGQLWADLGLHYQWTPDITVGIYTDQWLQVSELGSVTLRADAVPRLYGQLAVDWQAYSIELVSNLDVTRLSGEYRPTEGLSLDAATLLRLKSTPTLRGYQLGAGLQLEQLALHYRYVTLLQTGISDTQHLVGLSYRFSGL